MSAGEHVTLEHVMALFLRRNEERSQLQEKISADLSNRLKAQAHNSAGLPEPAMLDESEEATGRSLFWVGVVTMVVIALVVFVLFIFNGI